MRANRGLLRAQVASDEEAKAHWKRVNGGSNELPCVLVDGERVGVSKLWLPLPICVPAWS